jgi:hypothetical protein
MFNFSDNEIGLLSKAVLYVTMFKEVFRKIKEKIPFH